MRQLLLIISLSFSMQAVKALETDQYIIWKQLANGQQLEDSITVFNDYVNGKIPAILTSVNKWKKFKGTSCKDVTIKVYKSLGGSSGSKIIYWANNNSAIERFPDNSVSNNQFYDMTIFRGNKIFRSPLARTIKMNGVYFGTDKLQHFISVGYSYYKNYVKDINRGETEQEALAAVLNLGVFTEESYLGQYASGVFSYADLDANFQGVLFGIDICAGDNPYLTYTQAEGWTQTRPIDMANYINPNWDESFNSSYYKDKKWPSIQTILQQEYCALLKHESIIQLRQYYQQTLTPSMASVDLGILRDQGDIPNNQLHDINTVCQ